MASLSLMMKPELLLKECSYAGSRSPGVKEGGANRKLFQEHERPERACGAEGDASSGPEIHNGLLRLFGSRMGS
jgi:hypothetical protein